MDIMIIDKWSWADYLYLRTFFDPQGRGGKRASDDESRPGCKNLHLKCQVKCDVIDSDSDRIRYVSKAIVD